MVKQRGTLFHAEGPPLPPTRMARRCRDALSRDVGSPLLPARMARMARQRGTLSLVEGMQPPPVKKPGGAAARSPATWGSRPRQPE